VRLYLDVIGRSRSDGAAGPVVAGYPREHGAELLVDVDERQADFVTAESQPSAPGDLGAQVEPEITAPKTDVFPTKQRSGAQDTHAARRQVQHRSEIREELLLRKASGDPATIPAAEEPAQSNGGVELHAFNIVAIVPRDEPSAGQAPKEATIARVGRSTRSKWAPLNQDGPDRR